jgi:SAM-dependent methyltransferase
VVTTTGPLDFTVRLVCCADCGLVYQDPPQDERKLIQYYQSMYREEGCRPPEAVAAQFAPRAEFLAELLRGVRSPRLAEIGCADGAFLAAAAVMGCHVEGVEPSPANAFRCRERGILVFQGTSEEWSPQAGSLDAACSYYVMEHVPSPARFLAVCNRALRPGGALVLEIPDIASYDREPTASDLLFFFEHQTHFSRETAEALLARSGFAEIRTASMPTQPFGMHLGAVKTGPPLPAESVRSRPGAADRALELVRRYLAHRDRTVAGAEARLRAILHNFGERGMRVAVFGAGSYARQLLELPGLDRRALCFAVDNDAAKWGGTVAGLPVRAPAALSIGIDAVLIASGFQAEIRQQLHAMGVDACRIEVL